MSSAPPRRQFASTADDAALTEAAAASEGSVARALTLLGGDALKLQQRTAALLAALPKVDPRELHALGDSLPLCDRVALAAFIDGVDRWISERLRTMAHPMRTCPALHGWRRCGKRSPAPRATPKTIILNENRWFSRCSRCLRTLRDKRPVDPIRQFLSTRLKDFAVAPKSLRKRKRPRRLAEARRQGRRRKSAPRKSRRRKRRQEGQEEGREKAAKKPQKRRRQGEPRRNQLRKPRSGQHDSSETQAKTGPAKKAAAKPAETAAEATSRSQPRQRQRRAPRRAQHLLHHDRDRLSERPAAYRPRL